MDMDIVGWIIVGFLAGWLSAMVVPGNTARGCLPNILVGVLGGIVGGWLSREFGFGGPGSFVGALIVAFVGAVLVRIIIGAVTPPERR